MKVLVTGRQGQLARSLIERRDGRRDIDLVCVGRPEVDLEVPGSLASAIRDIAPDLVVNAAAYTAVDRAEDEPARAFRVNADAAGEAALAAQEMGAPIIQISTDYVFDGRSDVPYREDGPTNPIGVYGQSKLAGEEQVRTANPRHLILRTSWLYSPFGSNFVKTMLRLAHERPEIAVVDDQHGTPTSALDLADAILDVLLRWSSGNMTGLGKTLHFAGASSCSWAEFATAIFAASTHAGGPSAAVQPITTADYPTKAKRPANSALDSSTFSTRFAAPIPDWRESMPLVVLRLLDSGNKNGASLAGTNRAG